jgi:ABC-2 type transport system ATP-binding protein
MEAFLKAIEVQQLTKIYRSGKKALDALNMSVNSGEVFTLLGQNGAGKSTLIHLLTTLIRPTSGSAVVLGKDLVRDSDFVRGQIACVA